MNKKAQTIEVGEPMDNETFNRFLRSGRIPVRLDKSYSLSYDLKIAFRLAKAGIRRHTDYRIHFGAYFRNPELNATAIAFGPGTPYKTESIIALLDAPVDVAKSYAITTYLRQESIGKKTVFTVGATGSKALIESFYSTAKDAGIELPTPKKPGDSVIILCSLIPIKKGDSVDLKTCIIQIDDIQRSL